MLVICVDTSQTLTENLSDAVAVHVSSSSSQWREGQNR